MANKPYDPLRRSRYIAALRAALGEGEKLAHAAAIIGVSVPHASRICDDAGIRRMWTTEEERTLLAEIRAGRALVVRRESAPAAARLAKRLCDALAEYRSGSVSGS